MLSTGPEKKWAHSKSLDSKQQSLLTLPTQFPGTTSSVCQTVLCSLSGGKNQLYMLVQCLSSQETLFPSMGTTSVLRKPSLQYLACPFPEPNTTFCGPAVLSYKPSPLKEQLAEVFVNTTEWTVGCMRVHTPARVHIHRHTHVHIHT